MAPSTKVMCFKASSSYLQDPTQSITELANQSSANKIEGLSKFYYGFETEDPSNAFWVFEWSSQAAHEAYHRIDTDDFKDALATSQQLFASKPTQTIVNFSDPSRIFSAPVTEFVTFTLKSDVSMNALQPLVTQLQAELQETPNFYGSDWAPVVGKPNVVYGVLGWESVQAHWDAVSSGPLKEIIDEVKKIADLWLVHVALNTNDTWLEGTLNS